MDPDGLAAASALSAARPALDTLDAIDRNAAVISVSTGMAIDLALAGPTGEGIPIAGAAFLGIKGLGAAGRGVRAGLKALIGRKRVGRHMSPKEFEKMRRTGRVQEGGSGQTRVADPADPRTYRNPPKNDVYVEFDVPANRVLPHSKGTGRIPGPGSYDAKVPGRNPKDFEMPRARNIKAF